MRYLLCIPVIAFVVFLSTIAGGENKSPRNQELDAKFQQIKHSELRWRKSFCKTYELLLKRSRSNRDVQFEQFCKQLRTSNVLEKGPRYVKLN